MAKPLIFDMPSSAYVLWCGNYPVPVPKDPAGMSQAEKSKWCLGQDRFQIEIDKFLVLVEAGDGNFKAIIRGVADDDTTLA